MKGGIVHIGLAKHIFSCFMLTNACNKKNGFQQVRIV